jgi:hypothetical protein
VKRQSSAVKRWSLVVLVLVLLGWTGTTIVAALVRGGGHGAVFIASLCVLGLVCVGLLILLRRMWRLDR